MMDTGLLVGTSGEVLSIVFVMIDRCFCQVNGNEYSSKLLVVCGWLQ